MVMPARVKEISGEAREVHENLAEQNTAFFLYTISLGRFPSGELASFEIRRLGEGDRWGYLDQCDKEALEWVLPRERSKCTS